LKLDSRPSKQVTKKGQKPIIEKAMPIIYVQGSEYTKGINTTNGENQTKD
jgi:hypothetical protein